MTAFALPIARDVAALRETTSAWRAAGHSVALAPTMGALHVGHLSLIAAAKARHGRVIASLFVNPKQFAPTEDFDRYPRDEAGDAAKLASAGCDLLYAPHNEVMYPPGFATAITVTGVSAPLEGQMRPHFFGGVATVVAKLLLQALPDAAYFGEKDYQQLQVIKRMAHDLDLPTEIIGCPTVRESDGLALSSRNAYLSAAERAIAGQLNHVMRDAISAYRAGGAAEAVEQDGAHRLRAAGFEKVDYFTLRHAETLGLITSRGEPARLLAAAWLGKTRLIDNMGL